MEILVAYAMTFPRELKNNPIRDLDHTFILIWSITFLLLNSVFYYLQTMPVKELTEDQVLQYTKAIYRVTIERQPVENRVETASGKANQVLPIQELETIDKPTNDHKPSLQDKRVLYAQKKAERLAELEAKRKAIGDRVKMLVGPVSKGNDSKRGFKSTSEAVGLQSGILSDVDLKNGALAIATDAGEIAAVKKLRGEGVVSEDIENISIDDIKYLLQQPGNLEEMLAMASVKLPENGIVSTGEKSGASARSQKSISEVVLANKNQVQYCYWTFKRRDATLKGQVTVQFTINPAGKVVQVYFRKSDWNRNPLKLEIEHCIRNVISQWIFEPITASKGDVNASATFIFE